MFKLYPINDGLKTVSPPGAPMFDHRAGENMQLHEPNE